MSRLYRCLSRQRCSHMRRRGRAVWGLVGLCVLVLVYIDNRWLGFQTFTAFHSNLADYHGTNRDNSTVQKRGPFRFSESLFWNSFNLPGIGDDVLEDVTVRHQKYFIYRCDVYCGGWADRLNGVVFGYLIANLTGRVFKAEFLNPPCNMSDFLIPNGVNWSLPISPTLLENKNKYIVVNRVSNKAFTKRISTTNLTEIFDPNKTFIYYKSNYESISTLKKSELYANQLSWMSNLTASDVYAAVYKHLFKLSPRLQSKLQLILHDNLPSSNHKLVCVHVRMGRNPSIAQDSEVRNSMKNLPKIWSFVSNHSASDLHKVFVMSDSDEVLTSAKQQPFKDRLVTVPGPVVHVDRHAYKSSEVVCAGLEKLLLEHHLLMTCDLLVRGHSGLSKIAAAVRATDRDLYCLTRTGDILPCLRSECLVRSGHILPCDG